MHRLSCQELRHQSFPYLNCPIWLSKTSRKGVVYSVPQLRKLSPIRLLSGSESEVLVTAAEDKLGLHLVISGLMSLTGKKGHVRDDSETQNILLHTVTIVTVPHDVLIACGDDNGSTVSHRGAQPPSLSRILRDILIGVK